MADEQNEGARVGGVDMPDYLRPIYSNFVNVNHTPWDFRLAFAVIQAPLPGREREAVAAAGEVMPIAVADIILPASLMHGLISALQDNFSKYLTQFGPPGLDPEGPRPPSED
jgi:hypothetical protein